MNDDILRWVCDTCSEGVDAPNKGLGRAIIAAWKTRHQGHEIIETRERP